jgi:hypothetical protein
MSGNSGDFSSADLANLGKLITDRINQCLNQQSIGHGDSQATTSPSPGPASSGTSSGGSTTPAAPSSVSAGPSSEASPGSSTELAPGSTTPTLAPCPTGSASSGSGSRPDSGSGDSKKKDQGSDDAKTSAFIGPTLTRSASDCAGSIGTSAVDGTSAAASGALAKIPTGPTKQLKIWLTGYSYQDNTPPGSSIVSAPLLHQKAGGTGTYTDPITVAAPGHNDGNGMGFAPGTRFYLPSVQRYVIVEDSGASPAPSGTDGHLDMWVDGEGGDKSASDDCMNRITSSSAEAIENPPPGEPVTSGPITKDGQCNLPSGAGSSSPAASSTDSSDGDSR